MADFFSSRLLRWLIVPYRSRLVNTVSKPFSHVADRILGTQFLADISEFFILFQSMYDGFVAPARRVGGERPLITDHLGLTAHVAMNADHRRQPGRQAQVRRLVLDRESEKFGNVHL